MHPILNPLKRGLFATLLAAAVVAVVVTVAALSWQASPSNPPWRPSDVLTPLLGSPFVAALTTIWLLPVCVVIKCVMTRRRVHRIGSLFVIAALATCGVVVTLLLPEFFTGIWDMRSLLDRIEWLTILGAIFVWVWFQGYAHRSPRAAEGRPQPRALRDLVLGTSAETLAVVGVFAWSAFIGGIVGFGHDGGPDWRVDASVLSPDGAMRADQVTRIGEDDQFYVFLLPRGRRWTQKHRGLLVWDGDETDAVEVRWESPRSLVVRVRASSHKSSDAWSRSGYSVREEIVPADAH